MQTVHGHYNGKVVVLDEPVDAPIEAEVLVLFRNGSDREASRSAREQLRGSGKGEQLVKKLLTERRRDGTKDR
jgi:hypothetical protein